jgi:hypothetical protein
MPRAPNAVFAIIALAACGREAVAPPPVPIQQVDAPLVAPAVAAAAVQVTSKSTTAGLDDVLLRLIPAVGTLALALRDPVSALRDDLKSTNSTARASLLTVTYRALDRIQAIASAGQQPDLSAIRLALDAVRADEENSK